MANTIKALASGQLAASKGTLYTVPSSTSTIVRSITLVNTDTVARTVNLYVSPSGTSRRISPKTMTLEAGDMFVFDQIITIETGDLLEGDASVASVVDYVINGVESV